MSSLETPMLFDDLNHPLRYAEELLSGFNLLAASRGALQLQHRLVQTATNLTGCPLGQLFLLDAHPHPADAGGRMA